MDLLATWQKFKVNTFKGSVKIRGECWPGTLADDVSAFSLLRVYEADAA